METKELIDKFEKNLRRKKANDKTIRNYIYDLQAFNSYMNKSLEEITEEDINNFIQEKKDRGIKPNRINFSISVLISFYKYLNRNYFVKNNPMKNISRLKVPKKEETILPIDKIKEIRKKLEEKGNTQLCTFFAILCCSCPNKGNIAKIEWRRVNWKKKYIEVVVDDNTRSIIYLDNYAIKQLEKLRKERHDKGLKRKHIFITKYKGWSPVTDNTVTNWLDKIAEIGNVDKLTFGIMRNTCKEYLKKVNKLNDEQINRILSWKSFETEFKYLILDEIENLKNKNN